MNIWIGNAKIPKDLSEALEITKSRLKTEGDYYSGWELFSDDIIGHSGGTPNYSSRIVFSEKENLGVCVLSNLNVASSTDSLCNSIFEVMKEDNMQNSEDALSENEMPDSKDDMHQNEKKIATDVWTVFDIVFSVISFMGIIIFILALAIKNSKILIGSDIVLFILLMLILILFPIIFSAGLKEIIFIWAPISMSGGLAVMILDILVITFKIVMVKKSARNYKAG